MSENNTKNNSYLSFRLGNEYFATHVNKVINILEIKKITEVPNSPTHMKGVINLRGNVLPVIDAKIKLGMLPVEISVDTCILVLKILVDEEEVLVGALADAVNEVFEIKPNEIKPSPSIGKKYKNDYILGIINLKGRFLALLDMDKAFSNNEIINIKEVIEE